MVSEHRLVYNPEQGAKTNTVPFVLESGRKGEVTFKKHEPEKGVIGGYRFSMDPEMDEVVDYFVNELGYKLEHKGKKETKNDSGFINLNRDKKEKKKEKNNSKSE